VLVLITEPLWVEAFRVREVVGVTVQCVYWDHDLVSGAQFQWRVAFERVVSNTSAIHTGSWWVQPESFCEYQGKYIATYQLES
jgi:hypothetical protein